MSSSSTLYPNIAAPQAHRAVSTVLPNSNLYSDAQQSLMRATTALISSEESLDSENGCERRKGRRHHPHRPSRRHGAVAATTTTITTTTYRQNATLTLDHGSSLSTPLPLTAYVAASQLAISSALKIAILSTSFGLGIARTVVSGVDQALGKVVKTIVGEGDQSSGGSISPSQITSLPFRAALLGINFSDVLVQTILETVDGSVNLALSTIQDGMDLMDSLFGGGAQGSGQQGQASETFREVWMVLSRELASMNGASYPALEGMRLFLAYIAIQYATAEAWEAERIEQHCQLVGLCYEALDEQNGSKNSWRAVGPWPLEWRQPAELTTEMNSTAIPGMQLQGLGLHHFPSAPLPPSLPQIHVHNQPQPQPGLTIESVSSSVSYGTALDGSDEANDVIVDPPHYHASEAHPILESSPIPVVDSERKLKAAVEKDGHGKSMGAKQQQQQQQFPYPSGSSFSCPKTDNGGEEEEEEEEESLTRQLRRDLLPPPPLLNGAPVVEPTDPVPQSDGKDDISGEDTVLYPILDWREEPVPFSRVQTPVIARRADRMEKLDTPPSSTSPAATSAQSTTAEDQPLPSSPHLPIGKQMLSSLDQVDSEHHSLFSDQNSIQHPPQYHSTLSLLEVPTNRPTIADPLLVPLPHEGTKGMGSRLQYSLSDMSAIHHSGRYRKVDPQDPNPELRRFLADSYRFSRFCSAMYGEQALSWMGSPDIIPPPTSLSDGHVGNSAGGSGSGVSPVDHHFLAYTGTPLGSILYSSDEAATLRTGTVGEEKYYAPRYYVLDDAESKQIVLVLRGTKSLHDLMVDLTCDAADLVLDHETDVTHEDAAPSNQHRFSTRAGQPRRQVPYKVHAGFLKAARTMATVDTVGIQERIHWALRDRPDYSLLLIGHSLGAGIASVLTLLWADPTTGLTPPLAHGEDGSMALPPGRRVRCYAYGSPKVMCPRLSRRSTNLITSISYADDVVGRLSLGSVRNIGHAMRALFVRYQSSSPSNSSQSTAGAAATSVNGPPPSPPQTPPPVEEQVVMTAGDSEPVLDMVPFEQQMAAPGPQDAISNDTTVGAASVTTEPVNTTLPQATTAAAISRTSKPSSSPTNPESSGNASTTSIGLELIQKVIRWRLTKEAYLLEEFMEIRRAMHQEMLRYESLNLDEGEQDDASDSFSDDEEEDTGVHSTVRPMKRRPKETVAPADKCPALVPAGKVLWIRPSETEREIQAQDERQHPVDNVLHQFEWDHPGDYAHHHSQNGSHSHGSCSASRSTSLMDRFKENWKAAGYDDDPTAGLTMNTKQQQQQPTVGKNARAAPVMSGPAREGASSSASAAKANPPHRGYQSHVHQPSKVYQKQEHQQRVSNRILYRMYATPRPENVFEEMLFSRRMWSDHLPLTYEFVLAGKHAIPPSSTNTTTTASSTPSATENNRGIFTSTGLK